MLKWRWSWVPVFSLQSLLLFGLLIPSGLVLWLNWEPWKLTQAINLRPPRKAPQYRYDFISAKYVLNGAKILTFGQGGVQLWDESTLEELNAPDWTLEQYGPRAKVADNKLALPFFQEGKDGPKCWVEIFDLKTHALAMISTQHTQLIQDMAFSGDGQLMATGSMDGTVRVFSISTGTEMIELRGPEEGIFSVVFSNDNKFLIAGCKDFRARMYNLHSGHATRIFDGGYDYLFHALPSPDGKMILTSGRLKGKQESVTHLWNVGLVPPVATVPGTTDENPGNVFSPNGNEFLAGGPTTGLYTLDSGKLVRTYRFGGDVLLTNALISPNGERILFLGAQEKAEVFNLNNGESVIKAQNLWDHMMEVYAFSSSGMLALPDKQHAVQVWDSQTGEYLGWSGTQPSSPTSLEFYPQGEKILVGYHDNSIGVLERRRPANWWGIAWLPEFWLTVMFGLGFGLSLWRDRRTIRRLKVGGEFKV